MLSRKMNRFALPALALFTCAGPLRAADTDWKIAGPFGGTATTVTIDPKNGSVILAGGMDSLLFQSTDAGVSWRLLKFPKRELSEVASILVDPSDSEHYLVGTI